MLDFLEEPQGPQPCSRVFPWPLSRVQTLHQVDSGLLMREHFSWSGCSHHNPGEKKTEKKNRSQSVPLLRFQCWIKTAKLYSAKRRIQSWDTFWRKTCCSISSPLHVAVYYGCWDGRYFFACLCLWIVRVWLCREPVYI